MKNIFKNNTDIFRESVKSVTEAFDLKKVEDDVYFVELRFLIKIIGLSAYETLITHLYSNNLNEHEEKLLSYLRPAIGRLVIVARIPEASVSFGPGGILVTKTENSVPASEYKIKSLIRSQRSKAYEMLDQALLYLEANTAVFTQYAESAERTERLNSIVITAEQFRKAFGQPVPHVLLFMIQVFIGKMEREILVNTIGAAFYADLKELAQAQASGEALSAIDARVMELAQTAVTNLGMESAIPALAIQVDEDGITMMDNTRNHSAANNRLAATDTSVSALQRACQINGSANLKSLADYLNKHASASVFANYYNSDHYTDPNEVIPDWREDIDGGYFGL